MNLYRMRGFALLAVAVAACAEKQNGAAGTPGAADARAVAQGAEDGATGPVAAGGDLLLRNETYRELDGDEENAERLVATLSRGPLDSMLVRLEIRSSKDRILYRHEWPAVAYVKYDDPGSAKDSALVMRVTRRELAKILADSAFIRGSDAPRYSGQTTADLEAIRRDIAEHEYRSAKSLKKWDPLPPGAYDAVVAVARALPAPRIQAVAAETSAGPAFKYYAGGEENYVVAWSASEGRMVRIAACC